MTWKTRAPLTGCSDDSKEREAQMLRNRTFLVVAATSGALLAAVMVAIMPPDVQLGKLLRLVVFHGGSTWVNMALFTLAGLVGIVFSVTRNRDVYLWESGIRYVAMPLWVFNTALGMVSSKLSWNVIDFQEPRLQATFWILLGSAVVLALDFTLEKDRVTALADSLLAIVMWSAILLAPNLIHPDNPVMNSGWEIKGPFFGIVGGWLVANLSIAALVRLKLSKAPTGDLG